MLQPRLFRNGAKRRVDSDEEGAPTYARSRIHPFGSDVERSDYAAKRALSEHMAEVIRRLRISADIVRSSAAVAAAPDVAMTTERLPETPCPSEEDSDADDVASSAERRFLRSALRAQVRMPSACTALVPYVEPTALVLQALQRRTEPADDPM